MREHTLSVQQQLACCFIHTYTTTHGFPPTIREVAYWVGYRGMRSVELALTALVQRGYLKRQPHTRRSLTLTGQGIDVAQRWQLAVLEVA